MITFLRILGLATLLGIAVAGCTTLSVKRGDGDSEQSVGGVPFYVKTNVFRHVTGYARTDWEVAVRLEVLPSGTESVGVTRDLFLLTIPDSAYRSISMRALRSAIASGNSVGGVPPEQFGAILSKVLEAGVLLETCAGQDDCAGPHSLAKCPLVWNRVTREMIVDTSRTYFINGRRPLAGTAKTDFALGADLTLTTVKAEQDDKTLEQMLSVLPVKEYLTKELGLLPNTKTDTDKSTSATYLESLGVGPTRALTAVRRRTPVYFRFSLAATPKVMIYEVSQYLDAPANKAMPSPTGILKLDDARSGSAGLQLEVRSVPATPEKAKTEDPEPGYTISGTIVPPKSPPTSQTGAVD